MKTSVIKSILFAGSSVSLIVMALMASDPIDQKFFACFSIICASVSTKYLEGHSRIEDEL